MKYQVKFEGTLEVEASDLSKAMEEACKKLSDGPAIKAIVEGTCGEAIKFDYWATGLSPSNKALFESWGKQ